MKSYTELLGWSGLAVGVFGKLRGRKIRHRVDRPDCRHPLWLRLPSSDLDAYRQVFVDHEYAFKVEREPRVIVDAGANIGLASLYFANRYPGARIIAIEPERHNFDTLCANVRAYPNITPLRAALWNRDEAIDLVDPGLGDWGFMTDGGGASADLRHRRFDVVPGMTVDRLMKDHGIACIDILKMDIEGAEREVFLDPSPWIGKVNAMIVELHERLKTGCEDNFHRGAAGFDRQWRRGENVYVSHAGFMAPVV
ncbi:FkbM family methyltransferase [Aquariibacter albus]|uniref:FkbM family methyltransferase n=1 Tax=Aquariibacter albus TaxID=2759899 RepID=A0A839HSN5_9BURK|nr:FkbM family methyltransferase [Aquariibacter albus]MBB1162648.1 FkbM family methyltransferase [Aquariibacter albus]